MGHLKDIKVSETAPRKVGLVESDARDKTRTISINFLVKHKKYGKYVRRRTVLHVHDENNLSKKGDRIEVAECRPISKTKSWVLTRVIESSGGPMTEHQTTIQTEAGELGAEVAPESQDTEDESGAAT